VQLVLVVHALPSSQGGAAHSFGTFVPASVLSVEPPSELGDEELLLLEQATSVNA